MRLQRLFLASFRNLRKVEIEPGTRFNIFSGLNGQGKTNLLETIYLLGTLKSFRMARNTDLITWGSSQALLKGWVEHREVLREISLLIDRDGKRVHLDQKPVARPADFFGSLNVVVFSPDEMALAKGGPERRRRYLDRAVYSGDPSYLTLHHDYGRVLKNRNILLKSQELSHLEAWSSQLVETGSRLIQKRIAYLGEIEGLQREFYRRISSGTEEPAIAYRPHLLDASRLQVEGPSCLREGLLKSAAEERRTGVTVVGPHRDDVEFLLDGRSLKQFASQGQQRSFILALKMAEIQYILGKFAVPPILLLDDITSELDRERNRNLFDFLTEKEMQVFVTTTALENLNISQSAPSRIFQVDGGKILPGGSN